MKLLGVFMVVGIVLLVSRSRTQCFEFQETSR